MTNTHNDNEPLVIARDGEHLDLVTPRDDPTAGFVGWRLHWDGDEHSAPSPADAPEVYYLVETCSQQYSEECGAPTYGTQVWRIEDGRVTHSAWFEGCGSVERGLKELIDLYSLSESVEDLTVVQGRDADDCGRLYYLAF